MPLAPNDVPITDREAEVERARSGFARPPRIWLILSDKLGDNAQVRRIAEALPWPFEEKRMVVRGRYVLGKPRVRASLHHLDLARSDPLDPPWPDLVITIGRRMSMVALWIQDRSQGRTKIVLVGRPRTALHRFALVVTSAQYAMPDEANVLRLDYPLLEVDEAAIAAAAREWQSSFASLPRPLIALMVGGRIKLIRFSPDDARTLAEAAGRFAAAANGTLFVTTSRRTPQDVTEALAAALPPGAVLHRWTPEGRNNPYLALLGLADQFIVTGDSISMQLEIARLGRPLAIYPLPASSWLAIGPLQWLGRRLDPFGGNGTGGVLRAIGGLLQRAGLFGYPRDLTAMHEMLIRQGLAVRFGEPFLPGGPRAPDELPRVVARIRALMEPDQTLII